MFKTLATRKSLTTRYIEAGSFNAYKMIVFSFEDYSKGSSRFFSFSKISLSPLDFLPSFFLSYFLLSSLSLSFFLFLSFFSLFSMNGVNFQMFKLRPDILDADIFLTCAHLQLALKAKKGHVFSCLLRFFFISI